MKYPYTKLANFILDALNKIRLQDGERRVLGAIMRLTWGWNKKKARITHEQIAFQTNINRKDVYRPLKRLIERRIVVATPHEKGGQILRINKTTKEWLPVHQQMELLPGDEQAILPSDQQAKCLSTNRHTPIKRNKLKKRKKNDFVFEFPTWMEEYEMEWDQYLIHRKKIRKPPTEYAKHLAVLSLGRLKEKGFSPDHVINTAIENGWQGFWEPKGEDPNAMAKLREKYSKT